MSLVERAVEELAEAGATRSTREGDDTATEVPAGSDNIFDLDRAALEAQGFIVPSDRPQRLPQEMRAIKRRLLRRLKFYKADSRTRRRKVANQVGRNVVLVTSTSPAEGKTFTSVNLALSLALEDDVKVVLIDADVPRPRVLHHLGIKRGKGLTDKIANPEIGIPELLLHDRDSQLKVLSEGEIPAKSSDFFAQPALGNTVREIAHSYRDHLVIIDAPPVLAAPGTSLLAQYADEVVFVVRANQTPEPAVVAALDEVLEYNDKVSLVLNYSLIPGKYSHYGSYSEYYYQTEAKAE